jgi:hypothetical protein
MKSDGDSRDPPDLEGGAHDHKLALPVNIFFEGSKGDLGGRSSNLLSLRAGFSVSPVKHTLFILDDFV